MKQRNYHPLLLNNKIKIYYLLCKFVYLHNIDSWIYSLFDDQFMCFYGCKMSYYAAKQLGLLPLSWPERIVLHVTLLHPDIMSNMTGVFFWVIFSLGIMNLSSYRRTQSKEHKTKMTESAHHPPTKDPLLRNGVKMLKSLQSLCNSLSHRYYTDELSICVHLR